MKNLNKYIEFVNEVSISKKPNQIRVGGILYAKEGDIIFSPEVLEYEIVDIGNNWVALKERFGKKPMVRRFPIEELKNWKHSNMKKETPDWKPGQKYSINVLHEKEAVRDENTIKQFIEYNNINPLVFDVWKYARNNWNLYPEKISTSAMRYGGRFDTVVEIEFDDKNSELVLWHIELIWNSASHTFNNKLIGTGKFSYLSFSQMMDNGKRGPSVIKPNPLYKP